MARYEGYLVRQITHYETMEGRIRIEAEDDDEQIEKLCNGSFSWRTRRKETSGDTDIDDIVTECTIDGKPVGDNWIEKTDGPVPMSVIEVPDGVHQLTLTAYMTVEEMRQVHLLLRSQDINMGMSFDPGLSPDELGRLHGVDQRKK